jgi:hypothetical protein
MNCAVIVDNRNIDLTVVIYNHMKYLDGWELSYIKNFSGDYNHFLTSTLFWNQFQSYERILIFQHDSMILREGVDEFYEWDYVGAPWKANAPWARPDRKGGNGGLSLRNPKKSLNLLLKLPYKSSYGNEDVYFSKYLDQVDGVVAPYEVCKRFSVETEYQLGTFGYHAIEKHLSTVEVEQIKNQYD